MFSGQRRGTHGAEVQVGRSGDLPVDGAEGAMVSAKSHRVASHQGVLKTYGKSWEKMGNPGTKWRFNMI